MCGMAVQITTHSSSFTSSSLLCSVGSELHQFGCNVFAHVDSYREIQLAFSSASIQYTKVHRSIESHVCVASLARTLALWRQ